MLSDFKPYSLKLKNGLKPIEKPLVMGILNTTDDSFFDGGKYHTIDLALKRCEKMLQEGADIIDIGGQSTRPGAEIISADLEIERTSPVIKAIRKEWPDVLLSIDTFRSEVASICVENGADIVNDISAGEDDKQMIPTLAQLGVPYIAMHKKGLPKDMQINPQYGDIMSELKTFFSDKIAEIESHGLNQIIIDPGFGFGKTMENNYEIMNRLQEFIPFQKPILVGISRKTMIWKLLKTDPEGALNGSTVLNTVALLKGAGIIRVHDVKEAIECIKITGALKQTERR